MSNTYTFSIYFFIPDFLFCGVLILENPGSYSFWLPFVYQKVFPSFICVAHGKVRQLVASCFVFIPWYGMAELSRLPALQQHSHQADITFPLPLLSQSNTAELIGFFQASSSSLQNIRWLSLDSFFPPNTHLFAVFLPHNWNSDVVGSFICCIENGLK